jgi:hypothetical protein
MTNSLQWDEFPRCPICKEDIQDYDLEEADNYYECGGCGRKLVVTKHSTIKYFVTTEEEPEVQSR